MTQDRRAGFTLIELLVVIGVLSMLIAAFAPAIFQLGGRADKAADEANLRWHYLTMVEYRNQHKSGPRYTGHRFVFDSWIRNVCQRTEESFERFWVPGIADPRKDELQELARNDPKGYDAVWRTIEEVSSADTHYAGPGPEVARQRWYGDDKLPVMADDNEFAPLFTDNTVHVLLGGGAVRDLKVDPDFLAVGFNADEPDAKVEVGPNSLHPLLQKLEH